MWLTVENAHFGEYCQAAAIIPDMVLERGAGPAVGMGPFHFDSLSLTLLSLPFTS